MNDPKKLTPDQQREHAERMAKLWGELTGGRYVPSWHTNVKLTLYRVGWKPPIRGKA
jgi:hypothetical protein